MGRKESQLDKVIHYLEDNGKKNEAAAIRAIRDINRLTEAILNTRSSK